MPKQILNLFLLVSLCPEELLKIHRIHFIVFFITYTVRLYFIIINTHEGTRADDIIPPI